MVTLGSAVLKSPVLAAGHHEVTATYSGDSDDLRSAGSLSFDVVANKVPGPTVTLLERYGFHSQPTTLVLTFSQALDDARAENLNNYRIVLLGHLRRLSGPTDRGPRRGLRLRVAHSHSVAGQTVEHPPDISAHRERQCFHRDHQYHGDTPRCARTRRTRCELRGRYQRA